MAIWPFGRKSKRHTIQVSAAEATALHSSLEQDPPVAEPTLGRKPSRRSSKRQNGRLSRNGDGSDSFRGSARASSHRPISTMEHRTLEAEHDRAEPDHAPQRPLSRTESLRRQIQNGPNKLRKSKRRTDEILREREIRMLSSTPIDIPRRSTPLGGDFVLEHQRRRTNGRRADRYISDISLSIRDSVASSMSDTSDPHTYKVNAFAALTPRPVVRYVEGTRAPTARSDHPPAGKEPGRRDKDRLQAMTMSEENLYYSRRRVNELADSLDASALRELLDRDRRRREKQQIDDQEKLRRKLQERADAQQAEENQQATEELAEAQAEVPVESHVDTEHKDESLETQPEESTTAAPAEQSASWLRGESKGSEVARRESLESANVIGNVDDGSLREPKLAQRPSFARSHEMGMSRTTLSPSHSSLRPGFSSPSQSQIFGVGSTSDLSERRSSDTSGRRGNPISSLFRRGSSRLKRRYRERFHDSVPEVSNASHTSHESFYRIQTQSSPPPPAIIPPRTFIPTGTVKRPQSKFTEHFGDEPLSPPDSRLQSPDIPDQVLESSLENEENRTFLREPTPSVGVDIMNPRRRRHQSWNESIDAESDNVPLSQSLASIDSEGSWMSGQIFRRMSQKPSSPSPVRTNISSFGPGLVDGPADTHDEPRESIDSRGASSNVMGEPELENDLAGPDASKPAETWHNEVGRRPIVVNPTVRPKSTQGMLKSIPSLSPISAEDSSSVEEDIPHSDLQRVASVHGEIGHAEQD